MGFYGEKWLLRPCVIMVDATVAGLNTVIGGAEMWWRLKQEDLTKHFVFNPRLAKLDVTIPTVPPLPERFSHPCVFSETKKDH